MTVLNPFRTATGLAALKAAALDRSSVMSRGRRGLTPHSFYRYPGRFSPHFASSAIQLFSDQEQLILDPFSGSGTTVLESIRNRRCAVGVDISPIAHFVARTVSRPHAARDLASVESWLARQLRDVAWTKASASLSESFPRSNLDLGRNWRLAVVLDRLLGRLVSLPPRQADLVRLALLSSSQWAFEHRRVPPAQAAFVQHLQTTMASMVGTLGSFRAMIRDEWGPNYSRDNHQVFLGSADLEIPRWVERSGRLADAIVTSPPYPGVHLLYGRWQTDGRKESDLPSWIVGSRRRLREGDFTMFARREPENTTYFETLGRTMTAARAAIRDGGWAVHMVGFSSPERQLTRYLATMRHAGFAEKRSSRLATAADGRLWRAVPGRRWYARESGTQREVVLIFRAT